MVKRMGIAEKMPFYAWPVLLSIGGKNRLSAELAVPGQFLSVAVIWAVFFAKTGKSRAHKIILLIP